MPQGLIPDWLQAVITLIFIIAIVFLTLQQANEMRRIQQAAKARKVKTIVDCGGRREERAFSEGDYIGKRVECPGGEGEGVIHLIYAEQDAGEGKKGRLS